VAFIRSWLRSWALAVATGHVGGVVMAPLVLCAILAASPAQGGSELTCTCPNGPGAECPMHKGHESSSDDTRWRSSCGTSLDVVLSALTAFAAPVERSREVSAPNDSGILFPLLSDKTLTVAGSPDSPPPRS
jgi:hypothetical protein